MAPLLVIKTHFFTRDFAELAQFATDNGGVMGFEKDLSFDRQTQNYDFILHC